MRPHLGAAVLAVLPQQEQVDSKDCCLRSIRATKKIGAEEGKMRVIRAG